MTLKPDKLFMKGEGLYMADGEERIKFAERGLMKISDLIEDEGDDYFIRVKNRKYRIQQLKEDI